jgi:uncharacterized protein YdaU (DUF1376 family)
MHYYEHHIGDYAAATAHLSLIEDAIYCRMLRRYYLTESPLPTDVGTIARVIGARDETEIVKAILLEFFTLADDGWHQKRADEDISRVRVKAEKARASANARWDGANVKQECERIANASETHNERNAPKHQAPSSNHQVEAKEAKASSPAKAVAPPCPHDAIVSMYHELLPANPVMKVWDGSRESNLRARWREDAKRQSLDYWRRFFLHVAASPFLSGKVTGKDDRPFLPGLDWLVLPRNFAKVIENKYHDRSPA